MKIVYWSDYACPYCYIGETRLKKAIKELGLENEVEIETRAFELDPDVPKTVETITVDRFAKKYRLSKEEAQQQIDHISQLGIDEGIDFRYATTLYTNTRDAHRLTKLAQTKHDAALEDRVSELLFEPILLVMRNWPNTTCCSVWLVRLDLTRLRQRTYWSRTSLTRRCASTSVRP